MAMAGRYDLHELIRQFAAERFVEHPGRMLKRRWTGRAAKPWRPLWTRF
jgi:hypothetical protein